MKHYIFSIIAILFLFENICFAQQTQTSFDNADISIKFYDKTMYYSGDRTDNPIYVNVKISNNSSKTLRFKVADDRRFTIDFTGFDIKNSLIPTNKKLIEKRTTNQTIYFREITIESGEAYSFTENLRDYLDISEPSLYYIELVFYPELYKNRNISIKSNRLRLEIMPNPSAASSSFIPVEESTGKILQPQEISPDEVVKQTNIARQKGLWDQFFLYFDLEELLKRDPVRNKKYSIVSALERRQMLESYKKTLSDEKIDIDIISIPKKFDIETTTYTQTEGSVKVLEWFDNGTFMEKKRYTYFVRQRDGIWQIYDYTVDNLGTE